METTTAAINPENVSDELKVDPSVAMDFQYASDALKADPMVIKCAIETTGYDRELHRML
jgi:hypothetical protein